MVSSRSINNFRSALASINVFKNNGKIMTGFSNGVLMGVIRKGQRSEERLIYPEKAGCMLRMRMPAPLH